eukprot:4347644-Amphidinium_carterae.1
MKSTCPWNGAVGLKLLCQLLSIKWAWQLVNCRTVASVTWTSPMLSLLASVSSCSLRSVLDARFNSFRRSLEASFDQRLLGCSFTTEALKPIPCAGTPINNSLQLSSTLAARVVRPVSSHSSSAM